MQQVEAALEKFPSLRQPKHRRCFVETRDAVIFSFPCNHLLLNALKQIHSARKMHTQFAFPLTSHHTRKCSVVKDA